MIRVLLHGAFTPSRHAGSRRAPMRRAVAFACSPVAERWRDLLLADRSGIVACAQPSADAQTNPVHLVTVRGVSHRFDDPVG